MLTLPDLLPVFKQNLFNETYVKYEQNCINCNQFPEIGRFLPVPLRNCTEEALVKQRSPANPFGSHPWGAFTLGRMAGIVRAHFRQGRAGFSGFARSLDKTLFPRPHLSRIAIEFASLGNLFWTSDGRALRFYVHYGTGDTTFFHFCSVL